MGLDFAFHHALEMGEVARAKVLARRAYETLKMYEGEDSEATMKAKKKMDPGHKEFEEFGAFRAKCERRARAERVGDGGV